MRRALLASFLSVSGCLPTIPAGSGPIAAEAHRWSWVEFAESRCANGTATGVGVNPGDGKTLLIYLQGGGACWDSATCWGLFASAVNMRDGYGAGRLAGEGNLTGIPLINRSDARNPLREASYVFVPYCTGDLHAGDAEVMLRDGFVDRPTGFHGRTNFASYLERLAATWPDAEHVWLSGASAGGYGALFNAAAVQAAFPGARVDVIDDSGVPVSFDESRYVQQRTTWNVLPAGCDGCAASLSALLPHLAKTLPAVRIAVLAYRRDPVLESVTGLTDDGFSAEVDAMVAAAGATSGQRVFVVDGRSHVVLADGSARAGEVGWAAWLAAMAADDPAWVTRP